MWATTSIIGRFVYAAPFAVFGLNHFLNGPAMADMVPVPGGLFWIYFVGAALIAGSIGIMTRILGRWAALGLAVLLLLFVFTIHLPNLSDPALRMNAMISLLKDVSLAGGALTWAGIFGAHMAPSRAPEARRVHGPAGAAT